MKIKVKLLICGILLAPFLALSQVTPPTKDTIPKAVRTDSLAKTDSTNLVKKDTVVVIDTVVAAKKNCYSEWIDAFRARGSKPVTDGMQQVVIALKDNESCRCFMGQIEVSGGKIKPPLYFQKENGEYHLVSIVGKKLDPAFIGTLTPDELLSIKNGMSIVFRTSDQEYGRLFFYKFVNKSAQSDREAPSPDVLLK